MKNRNLMRRVEWANAQGKWMPCELAQLEVGDEFRMFEPDGKRVKDDKGHKTWIVTEVAAVKCEVPEWVH